MKGPFKLFDIIPPFGGSTNQSTTMFKSKMLQFVFHHTQSLKIRNVVGKGLVFTRFGASIRTSIPPLGHSPPTDQFLAGFGELGIVIMVDAAKAKIPCLVLI